MNEASPPAEVPVMTISEDAKRLKFLSKYSKCAKVLLDPLKNSCLSLYLIDYNLDP